MPCLTLEVCPHYLRAHMLFFEEGQSLITSSTTLPHNTGKNTHTHFLIARAAPVIADPIVRNGLCQSKERALAFGKRVLSTIMFSGCSCVSLALIVPTFKHRYHPVLLIDVSCVPSVITE